MSTITAFREVTATAKEFRAYLERFPTPILTHTLIAAEASLDCPFPNRCGILVRTEYARGSGNHRTVSIQCYWLQHHGFFLIHHSDKEAKTSRTISVGVWKKLWRWVRLGRIQRQPVQCLYKEFFNSLQSQRMLLESGLFPVSGSQTIVGIITILDETRS